MGEQCMFRWRIGEIVEQCPEPGEYGVLDTPDNLVKYGRWAVDSRWCKKHRHTDDVLLNEHREGG